MTRHDKGGLTRMERLSTVDQAAELLGTTPRFLAG
jgi:hypothetical protein